MRKSCRLQSSADRESSSGQQWAAAEAAAEVQPARRGSATRDRGGGPCEDGGAAASGARIVRTSDQLVLSGGTGEPEGVDSEIDKSLRKWAHWGTRARIDPCRTGLIARRYEKRHSNFSAHCSPAFRVKEGDTVVCGQCR